MKPGDVGKLKGWLIQHLSSIKDRVLFHLSALSLLAYCIILRLTLSTCAGQLHSHKCRR